MTLRTPSTPPQRKTSQILSGQWDYEHGTFASEGFYEMNEKLGTQEGWEARERRVSFPCGPMSIITDLLLWLQITEVCFSGSSKDPGAKGSIHLGQRVRMGPLRVSDNNNITICLPPSISNVEPVIKSTEYRDEFKSSLPLNNCVILQGPLNLEKI